jgi:hypothetical protein
MLKLIKLIGWFGFMVLNTTFNNISVQVIKTYEVFSNSILFQGKQLQQLHSLSTLMGNSGQITAIKILCQYLLMSLTRHQLYHETCV